VGELSDRGHTCDLVGGQPLPAPAPSPREAGGYGAVLAAAIRAGLGDALVEPGKELQLALDCLARVSPPQASAPNA